jgi:hypothetical protein
MSSLGGELPSSVIINPSDMYGTVQQSSKTVLVKLIFQELVGTVITKFTSFPTIVKEIDTPAVLPMLLVAVSVNCIDAVLGFHTATRLAA